MEIYVKNLLFPYFFFFLIYIHDFLRSTDFTRIAASNAQVMMSLIRSHRVFDIDLSYSCVHFVVNIDEKFKP